MAKTNKSFSHGSARLKVKKRVAKTEITKWRVDNCVWRSGEWVSRYPPRRRQYEVTYEYNYEPA